MKILSKIRKTLVLLPMIFAFSAGVAVMSLPAIAAASTTTEISEGVESVSQGNTSGTDLEDIIRIVINAILFLIGIVAVIMIIISGFRYIMAQGDTGQVTTAKNTLLYSIIGLVIAIAAFAIVNFVLDAFN